MVDQQTAVLMGKLAWHQAHVRGLSEPDCERAANKVYLDAIRVEIPASVYREWTKFDEELKARRRAGQPYPAGDDAFTVDVVEE